MEKVVIPSEAKESYSWLNIKGLFRRKLLAMTR